YSATGTLLATANGGSAYGGALTVTVNGLTPGQICYVRAEGNSADVFGVGGYRLNAQFGILAPGVVNHFQISTPPSTTAGLAVPVTVRALDAFGNVATDYGGTIQFSSSDAQAGLPASYTFQPSDGGQRTFGVLLKTAGSQSVTVADTLAGSINASASIGVSA